MIADPTIEEAMLDMVKRKIYGRTTALQRVFLHNAVPQDTVRPYVTVELIDDLPEQATDGPVGLSRALFGLTAWSDPNSAGEAIRIAKIIAKRIDNVTGIFGGVEVSAVTRGIAVNMPEPQADGREFSLHGKQVQFEVWYQERN